LVWLRLRLFFFRKFLLIFLIFRILTR